MSSITLGGIRDVDLGFRVLAESEEPLAPSTRDTGMTISGNHGTYDFGAELEAKPFVYKCAFIPNGTDYANPSAEELQRCVRRLAGHLIDAYGRPKNIKLERAWEPGQYYIARYSGSTPLDRIAYNSIGLFTLPLIAFNPFSYGNQERLYEYTISNSEQGEEIESFGNVATSPVIRITNTGSNAIHGFTITLTTEIKE